AGAAIVRVRLGGDGSELVEPGAPAIAGGLAPVRRAVPHVVEAGGGDFDVRLLVLPAIVPLEVEQGRGIELQGWCRGRVLGGAGAVVAGVHSKFGGAGRRASATTPSSCGECSPDGEGLTVRVAGRPPGARVGARGERGDGEARGAHERARAEWAGPETAGPPRIRARNGIWSWDESGFSDHRRPFGGRHGRWRGDRPRADLSRAA